MKSTHTVYGLGGAREESSDNESPTCSFSLNPIKPCASAVIDISSGEKALQPASSQLNLAENQEYLPSHSPTDTAVEEMSDNLLEKTVSLRYN